MLAKPQKVFRGSATPITKPELQVYQQNPYMSIVDTTYFCEKSGENKNTGHRIQKTTQKSASISVNRRLIVLLFMSKYANFRPKAMVAGSKNEKV